MRVFYLCYNTVMKYVFILGHNPKLSVAEVLAVLPDAKAVEQSSSFLIVETKEFDPKKLMDKMGGSIKIAEVISEKIDKKLIVETLRQVQTDSKLNFGISYYECKSDKLGMEVKGELKKAGISCRLVVGKDKALSSVIVQKNKVHEFLIIAGRYLAQTKAVQDFEAYGKRDFARPERDMVSGSMPPKLAQIMINLSQVKMTEKLHDPFCGSGTILQEALVMGYKKVSGSDKSERAVSDTRKNLAWLSRHFEIPEIEVSQVDVRELSASVKDINVIVTEPYLGPPLRGGESREQILKNVDELEDLYVKAFEQFSKVLNKNGRVVIVFPTFRVGKEVLKLRIMDQIEDLGFIQTSKDDLFFSRPDQKVYRDIRVFAKN